MMKLLAGAAVLATVCGLSACGHASSVTANPTTRADEQVLVHQATKILNSCLPNGVVQQKTPLQTIAQPAMIDAMLHHREPIEDCWQAHGAKPGITACVVSQVAQAPSDLASQTGRDALGQAIFSSCLVLG